MGDSDDESDAGEEEEDDEDIKPRLPSTKITKKKLVIPSPYTSQPTPTSSAPTAGLAGLSRSDDLSMNMNIALGGKTRDEAEFIQATATRLAQIMYEKQMQQQEAEREKSRRAAEKKKKINLGLGRKSKVVHPPGGTGSPVRSSLPPSNLLLHLAHASKRRLNGGDDSIIELEATLLPSSEKRTNPE